MVRRRRTAPDVEKRIASLRRALAAGGDRFEPEAIARASATLERAEQRLLLGTDHTIVALVGSTGSGKSTLFNRIAGREISESGTRRPTTSKPFACIWGGSEAAPVLDWLEVPQNRRAHQVPELLTPATGSNLAGLVLLDVPDHDSTELSHRLEVDRLVNLVDMLIWVVDPQKYADEALHAGYLQQLTSNTDVMLIVLNQIDRLGAEAGTVARDLRRLVDADGLEGVEMLAVSATRGDGLEELTDLLVELVTDRSSAAVRVAAALDDAVAELTWGVGEGLPLPRRLPGERELEDALVEAVALPAVMDAVAADYRRQARRQVGWPLARWIGRLPPLRRRDALGGLRLGVAGEELRRITVSSAETSTPAQVARVDLAVHDLTAAAAESLPPRWVEAVAASVDVREKSLVAALDAAVREVDLHLRRPLWWPVLQALHVMTALTTLGALVWLAAYPPLNLVLTPDLVPLRVQDLAPLVDTFGIATGSFVGLLPASVALLVASVVVAVALSLLSWTLVRVAMRRRRRYVNTRMRHVLRELARQRVILPVRGVLTEHLWTHQALVEGR